MYIFGVITIHVSTWRYNHSENRSNTFAMELNWKAHASEMGLRTFNPIRSIVDFLKKPETHSKTFIPLSIGISCLYHYWIFRGSNRISKPSSSFFYSASTAFCSGISGIRRLSPFDGLRWFSKSCSRVCNVSIERSYQRRSSHSNKWMFPCSWYGHLSLMRSRR